MWHHLYRKGKKEWHTIFIYMRKKWVATFLVRFCCIFDESTRKFFGGSFQCNFCCVSNSTINWFLQLKWSVRFPKHNNNLNVVLGYTTHLQSQYPMDTIHSNLVLWILHFNWKYWKISSDWKNNVKTERVLKNQYMLLYDLL